MAAVRAAPTIAAGQMSYAFNRRDQIMRELYRRYRGPRPSNPIRFMNRGKLPPQERGAAGGETATDKACGAAPEEAKKPETPAPKAS